MSQQSHDLGIVLHSAMPLPPIVTESLPITLQDVYEVLPGHWVTIVTQTASAGEIGLCELETQLQTLLPDHGVTVQKDAECLPQE